MKKLLLAGLTAAALTACSKSEDAKPTASLVGTWTLTSKTIVRTPKAGGTSTTYQEPVVPNTARITYAANGSYTTFFDKSISATGTDATYNGTYTYSGNTITYSANGKTSTARVDVLTSSDLTSVASVEDVSGTYVSVVTNKYTR